MAGDAVNSGKEVSNNETSLEKERRLKEKFSKRKTGEESPAEAMRFAKLLRKADAKSDVDSSAAVSTTKPAMNEVAMKIPTAILDNLKSQRVVRSVVVEKGVKIDAAALLCHQWTTARITNRSITEGDMIRINHMGMHLILREEEEVTNLSVESEVQATMIRVDATVQMGD